MKGKINQEISMEIRNCLTKRKETKLNLMKKYTKQYFKHNNKLEVNDSRSRINRNIFMNLGWSHLKNTIKNKNIT